MQNDKKIGALSQLQDEIAYRREKRWKIFSWAASILTVIIGGLVTIKTDLHRNELLSWQLKMSVGVGAAVITLFSIIWLRQNLEIERMTREFITKNDEDSPLKLVPTEPRLGYMPAIFLLFIAVCIALFF